MAVTCKHCRRVVSAPLDWAVLFGVPLVNLALWTQQGDRGGGGSVAATVRSYFAFWGGRYLADPLLVFLDLLVCAVLFYPIMLVISLVTGGRRSLCKRCKRKLPAGPAGVVPGPERAAQGPVRAEALSQGEPR